ncbi:MAG: hypothetical protein AAF928_20575 [Myxococcota bacterium]
MSRTTRVLAGAAVAVLLAACSTAADEPDDDDDGGGSSGGQCGPNEVLHGGAGVPPHCHCDDGYVDVNDTCVPASQGNGTTTSTGTGGPTTSGGGGQGTNYLPASCFAGSSPCEPRTGEGCAAGETCDLDSEGQMVCFPPPNTAALGQPCNNGSGPFCAAGGWCLPGAGGGTVCQQVCCADAECTTPGETCVPVFQNPQMGSLGTCGVDNGGGGGTCLPAGALCSPSNDECCGHCHIDHCH